MESHCCYGIPKLYFAGISYKRNKIKDGLAAFFFICIWFLKCDAKKTDFCSVTKIDLFYKIKFPEYLWYDLCSIIIHTIWKVVITIAVLWIDLIVQINPNWFTLSENGTFNKLAVLQNQRLKNGFIYIHWYGLQCRCHVEKQIFISRVGWLWSNSEFWSIKFMAFLVDLLTSVLGWMELISTWDYQHL